MNSDAQIQRAVEAELRSRPPVEEMHVAASVHEGIVRLTGFVRSYCEKYRTENTVKRVAGVAGVVNDIEVRLTSAEHLSDEQLRCAAIGALQTEVPALCDRINVRVHSGQITLEGSVDWHFLRERAESAVRRLRGVTIIHNAIAIEPAALAAEIQRRIEFAFTRGATPGTTEISVDALGSEVTLRGHARSSTQRHLAEQTAWAVPCVTKVKNDITVGA